MTDNVAVLFDQSSAPYEAGDIAGFPPAQAQDLVDRGIASLVGVRSAASAEPVAPPEPDATADPAAPADPAASGKGGKGK